MPPLLPKFDEKASDFFGQKWPFQEVKFFYFNHAIICQSPQSVFEWPLALEALAPKTEIITTCPAYSNNFCNLELSSIYLEWKGSRN